MPRLRRRRKEHRHLTVADVVALEGADLSWGWPTIADVQTFYKEHRADFIGPPRHNEAGKPIGTSAGHRPWCWWKFDAKQPRDTEREESEQLFAMKELANWELAKLIADGRPGYTLLPFRRPWWWWEFISHDKRDPGQLEAAQIIAIGELSAQEQAIVEDPFKATNAGLCAWRTRFYYLSQQERDLLGIAHRDLDAELLKYPQVAWTDLQLDTTEANQCRD